MNIDKIQASFGGGELSTSLYARVDLAKYHVGARLLRNFIVHKHGGASNRPGFEYICEVKDSTKATRILPFEYNDEQTYILEKGDQYLRVLKDGEQVLVSPSAWSAVTAYVVNDAVTQGGTTYLCIAANTNQQPPNATYWRALTGNIFEIGTPYLEADLFPNVSTKNAGLKYTQSNDVMTITHKGYAPRDLSRTGHAKWALTTIDFSPTISAPTGLAAVVTGSAGTNWKYKVTAIKDETLEESLPTSEVTASAAATLNSSNYVTLNWNAVSGATKYDVYKERNGLYGWIGTTETAGGFKDDGIDPDLDETPPTARNPFGSAGNYPGTVGYHEQRKMFGGSTNKPQTIWGTQSSRLTNMNVSSPTRDDDAITIGIASRQNNAIRHLVSLNALIAMTAGAAWSFAPGTQADVLTPTGGTRIKPEHYSGCSDVPPLLVGNRALYLTKNGRGVRDLAYEYSVDGFRGGDLSVLANHLFRGRQIKMWAYAEHPDSIIWAVRNDGKLLSFTYLHEHEVFAWTQHETDGKVEDVTVVTEGFEDRVYIVVRRRINGAFKRFIERLHTRDFESVRDAFFVDCGLTHDDPKEIEGITSASPPVVTSTAHGIANGSKVYISDVEGCEDEDGESEVNGVTFLVANATANTFELKTEAGAAIDGSAWSDYLEGGYVRKLVTTLSGYDHLNGEEVAILADGNVLPRQTVSGGAITLDRAASTIHVGLPYTADLKTLDIDLGQPTVSGKMKRVAKVTAIVEYTRGLWLGPNTGNASDLVEHKDRTTEAYGQPTALREGKLEVIIPAKWDKKGSIWAQVRDPLPVTILGLVPELTV